MIRFHCPICSKSLSVRDSLAGKRGRCPNCENKVDVPRQALVPKAQAVVAKAKGPLDTLRQEVVAKRYPVVEANPKPIGPPPKEYLPCPACGEDIVSTAVKCRWCNEYLEEEGERKVPVRRVSQADAIPTASPSTVNVNITNNQNPTPFILRYKRWNRSTAMLLSFFIPGLGQIYKGESANGLVWMFLTFLGYLAFIVPGLVLHFFCVLGAGMGDTYD